MSIQERIAELVETESSIKVVRAHLTIEGFKDKEITSAIKEAGLRSVKKGFASFYYDFLVAEEPTKVEAEDFIDGHGSYGVTTKNVRAHKSHYLGLWELANRIRQA